VSELKSDRKEIVKVRKRLVAGAILLVAILAGTGLFFIGTEGRRRVLTPAHHEAVTASVKQIDTGSKAPDTTWTKEHTKNTEAILHHETSLIKPPPLHQNPAVPLTDHGKKDTAQGNVSDTSKSAHGTAGKAQDSTLDTAGTGNAAIIRDSASKKCAGDTLAPWVFPEPSGGLHRGTVAVTFQTNKPCSVSWRFEPDTEWRSWAGERIAVERTATIAFTAIDRCGRTMAERREYYEITAEQIRGLCPNDMEFVTIGATQFCIDRYEWPNRKDALPQSYVSLYQAKDSCFIAGKRLCSTEEWSLACSGPYSWNYPYGQEYERYACVTHDTTVRRSGSKPECRTFFGAFDMSGNLMEWTGTPSRENRQFYNVMGGFWQSGPRSGCFDIRYSYFPQNRHNPVGFRCCKEIAPPKK
jgi:formylglycine-generating enzyme required for sulfatase activity